METKNVLMIFVKYPEPGKVKTRLAGTLGKEASARLYRRMAGDIIRRLALKGCGRYETVIFFDPPERASDVRNWLGDDKCYIQQSGGDLGERLSNAFRTVFNSGAGRAVVVGTDCPDVTQDIVTRALQHLREKDVVIGPAKDGGYYLLGLSSHAPGTFDSIDWSTGRVLQQTTEKIKQQGLSFVILEPLKDLDRPEDLPAAFLDIQRE